MYLYPVLSLAGLNIVVHEMFVMQAKNRSQTKECRLIIHNHFHTNADVDFRMIASNQKKRQNKLIAKR